jgi:hypothetical protein
VMTVQTRSPVLEISALPVQAPLTTPAEVGRAARPPLEAVLVRVGVRSAASPPTDLIDLWGEQSFPASDPPANW